MSNATYTAALCGRPGPWPFAGAFNGRLIGDGEQSGLAWAGRVTSGADLQLAWRASRALHHAIAHAGMPRADRRRALAITWARLDGVSRDLLGPNAGDGVSLLLLAWDTEGLAVSGVGLEALYGGPSDGELAPWLPSEHPLFGLPGLPTTQPGALTVDAGPACLIAVAQGDPLPLPALSTAEALRRCGVHDA